MVWKEVKVLSQPIRDRTKNIDQSEDRGRRISKDEIENIHSWSRTPFKCEFYGQFSKVLHHTIFMGWHSVITFQQFGEEKALKKLGQI